MAIVITNGTHYIWYTDTGATKKTSDINLAYHFSSAGEAIDGMRKAKGKTKGFYVYDTHTQYIIWKWMSEAERAEARRNKVSTTMAKRNKHGKIIRKTYSEDVRKLIYNNAGGRCELCGRKILFEDMTLDHKIPLSVGGADEVENLACVCHVDNLFKGNILPDDFMERISLIFLYQMEKKCGSNIRWKMLHKALTKMI